MEALFFAVSGLHGSGRSSLYDELHNKLNGGNPQFPNVEFRFIGRPFSPSQPHPLLWDEETRQQTPTSRLFHQWGDLNHFCDTKHLRQLQQCDTKTTVIISHGFGLDAFLYATACTECDESNDDALGMHESFIHGRLKLQKIRPPVYLVTHTDASTIMHRSRNKHGSLRNTRDEAILKFIAHEERMMQRYGEIKGQSLFSVDASDSPEETAHAATLIIRKHVDALRLRVA